MKLTLFFFCVVLLCVRSNVVLDRCYKLNIGPELCVTVSQNDCSKFDIAISAYNKSVNSWQVSIWDILAQFKNNITDNREVKLCYNIALSDNMKPDVCIVVNNITFNPDKSTLFACAVMTISLFGYQIEKINLDCIGIDHCENLGCGNNCNGQGNCTIYGLCNCDKNYFGPSCIFNTNMFANNCIRGFKSDICIQTVSENCTEINLKIKYGWIDIPYKINPQKMTILEFGADSCRNTSSSCSLCPYIKVEVKNGDILGCPYVNYTCFSIQQQIFDQIPCYKLGELIDCDYTTTNTQTNTATNTITSSSKTLTDSKTLSSTTSTTSSSSSSSSSDKTSTSSQTQTETNTKSSELSTDTKTESNTGSSNQNSSQSTFTSSTQPNTATNTNSSSQSQTDSNTISTTSTSSSSSSSSSSSTSTSSSSSSSSSQTKTKTSEPINTLPENIVDSCYNKLNIGGEFCFRLYKESCRSLGVNYTFEGKEIESFFYINILNILQLIANNNDGAFSYCDDVTIKGVEYKQCLEISTAVLELETKELHLCGNMVLRIGSIIIEKLNFGCFTISNCGALNCQKYSCHSHGSCRDLGLCKCDSNYFGPFCDMFIGKDTNCISSDILPNKKICAEITSNQCNTIMVNLKNEVSTLTTTKIEINNATISEPTLLTCYSTNYENCKMCQYLNIETCQNKLTGNFQLNLECNDTVYGSYNNYYLPQFTLIESQQIYCDNSPFKKSLCFGETPIEIKNSTWFSKYGILVIMLTAIALIVFVIIAIAIIRIKQRKTEEFAYFTPLHGFDENQKLNNDDDSSIMGISDDDE